MSDDVFRISKKITKVAKSDEDKLLNMVYNFSKELNISNERLFEKIVYEIPRFVAKKE